MKGNNILVDFRHICDMTAALNGLAVAIPGDDRFDEIRITCVDEYGDGGQYVANYIRHSIDGGFVYGGEGACCRGIDVEDVWNEVLGLALRTDEDFSDQEIEIFEMCDVEDINVAEL